MALKDKATHAPKFISEWATHALKLISEWPTITLPNRPTYAGDATKWATEITLKDERK